MDLSTLNKNSEKEKRAEKHLNKFLAEIQRHFDFSDYQIFKLLFNVSQKYEKKEKFFKKFADKFLSILRLKIL